MFGTTIFGVEPFGAAPAYSAVAPGFENCLFLSSRELDRATIVASSQMPALPASFVQVQDPAKRWRTVAKVNQHLNITLVSPLAIDTIAAVGTNFSPCAVWRLLMATTALSLPSAPDVNTGWRSVWAGGVKPIDEDHGVFTHLLRVANTQPFMHLRLEIADPSAEVSWHEFGRLFAGVAFQPAFNVDIDPTLGLLPPDAQGRTAFGRLMTDWRGAAARRLVLPMSSVTDTDMRRGLFALQRYCGLSRDFVFCLNPAATTDHHLYAMQAVFESPAQFQAQPWWDDAAQLWKTQLTIAEP